MRNGPGQTIRRIGRAVTKAAQALTSDLIRSTTEDEQELEGIQARTGEEGCADVEEQRDQSGDGDRAETDQEDDSEEGSENSDTSTVGTSAKIRLRRQHKKRFYQGRDDVYAHQ